MMLAESKLTTNLEGRGGSSGVSGNPLPQT